MTRRFASRSSRSRRWSRAWLYPYAGSLWRRQPIWHVTAGRPQHPHERGAHQCLTYVNRSKRDVWRFTDNNGEECPVTPTGALRGTSVEALLPTVLAGLAITELPEFIATQYFPGKQLEPILTDGPL